MATKSVGTKFKVEKFDDNNIFFLWQVKVHDLVIQQDLHVALEERPIIMSDEEWRKLNLKVVSTICLSLVNDVLCDILGEDSTTKLWAKQEILYMTKSLINHLFLKQQLNTI